MHKTNILFLCLILLFIVININYAKEIKAPDFSLFDVDKNVYRLSRITNIVVLNFFGTWCPPCRKEIPDFVKVSKEYKDKGVEFIGILVEKQYIIKNIKNFIKAYKIPYPVLMVTREVLMDYKIKAYPTTFIIDKHGYIVKKHLGLLSEKNLKEIIEKYLKLKEKEQKNVEAATNNKKDEK